MTCTGDHSDVESAAEGKCEICGWHEHECHKCGTIWEHNREQVDPDGDPDYYDANHLCPGCQQNVRERGRIWELVDCIQDIELSVHWKTVLELVEEGVVTELLLPGPPYKTVLTAIELKKLVEQHGGKWR